LIFSYAVRAYQSDQELGKKQKQKYFVDKNKIRAKIEERKRKIDEKSQVLQEAVKRRCLQEDQKHLYITNPAPNRRQRIRPCRLLTHEPLDLAKNQYEPFDRSHSGSLNPKCSMNSYSSLRDLNNGCV
jgi:hypothetical protein